MHDAVDGAFVGDNLLGSGNVQLRADFQDAATRSNALTPGHPNEYGECAEMKSVRLFPSLFSEDLEVQNGEALLEVWRATEQGQLENWGESGDMKQYCQKIHYRCVVPWEVLPGKTSYSSGSKTRPFPSYWGPGMNKTKKQHEKRAAEIIDAPLGMQKMFDAMLRALATRNGYQNAEGFIDGELDGVCLLYTSPSPRD